MVTKAVVVAVLVVVVGAKEVDVPNSVAVEISEIVAVAVAVEIA